MTRAAVLAAALLTGASVRAEITLESLLEEMTDYAAVARWPQPEFTCKQASSYDRATVAPDKPGWFANSDQNQFIRTETNQGRTEKVMLDADGPGCLVRFWLTTDRNKKGTLRFYLDGAEEPALAFPAYDLLSGDLGIGPPLVQPHPGYRPDSNGGNNFYLPIPYAKHCKVTWEEAGQSSRYYQINYRTYAPGTAVQTFSRAALEAARPAIERVNRALLAPAGRTAGRAHHRGPERPGERRTGPRPAAGAGRGAPAGIAGAGRPTGCGRTHAPFAGPENGLRRRAHPLVPGERLLRQRGRAESSRELVSHRGDEWHDGLPLGDALSCDRPDRAA